MKVLATGGAGYVGSHTVRALTRAGHDVTILDDLSRGHQETVAKLGVPLVQADLRDPLALEKALGAGYDAVLHFAALALVSESVVEPGPYWDVNFRGGRNLLEAMRRARIPRLIVSSTSAIYGEAARVPIGEDAPHAPVNPYGASKLAFEMLLRREAEATGLRALVLRYFNAVGASDEGDLGERHDPETHVVPRLLLAARRNEPFSLQGRDHKTPDGSCVRDFIHVLDVARAHVLALEKLDSTHEHTLNLGTGRGTSILEVVATAERVLGKKIAVRDLPRRAGDPASLVADPSRAEKALGFVAERTLDDGIRSAERFFRGF